MNDDRDLELEAASAAVDGLATSEERALVEASPSLQADVERFTAVRDSITDVAVPAAARESAVAAALAAFDALAAESAATPAVTPAANVVPLASRRRRQYRALVGAAAAVAVIGIGAVALNSGATDEESSAVTIAAESVVDGADSVVDAAPLESASGAGQTERAEESTAAEKTEGAPTAEDAADADAEAGDAASAEPPAASATTPLVILSPAEVTPAIRTAEELLAYADSAGAVVEDAPADTEADTEATNAAAADTQATDTQATETSAGVPGAPATTVATVLDPVTACTAPDSEYVGTVVYQGTPAFVVRIIDTDEVRALSTLDCTLLVAASR
jgi:hypothetical protein